MSSKDTITKTYMKDNAIFADAFNFYIYHGEQVIKPDDLHELDTAESVIFTSDENDSKSSGSNSSNSDSSDSNSSGSRHTDSTHQRYRDILKSAVIKQHGDTIYAVLGIENQSDIHYAMPVRNLIYDGLQYSRQLRDTAALHRAKGTHLSRQEYLSGFRKEDKLTPVITLVLYFGIDKWDGAKSIHEMLSTKDPKLLKYVQDYHINLIEPASIEPDELDRFSTSLREVLGYIKYANDKDKLLSFVTAKPDKLIDAEAARVINTMTKTHIDIPDDAKEVNMCKAIEDLINDSKAEGITLGRNEGFSQGINKGRAEGIALGRNEGIALGRNEGIALGRDEGIALGISKGIAEGISRGRSEGITEGIAIGKINLMSELVNDNLLSIKDAAARVGMTEDAFAAMLRR